MNLQKKYFYLDPENQIEITDARAFLRNTKKRYDMILLDAYGDSRSPPEHLLTAEFFNLVEPALNTNGIFVSNLVFYAPVDHILKQPTNYFIRLLTTLEKQFPNFKMSYFRSPQATSNILSVAVKNDDVGENQIASLKSFLNSDKVEYQLLNFDSVKENQKPYSDFYSSPAWDFMNAYYDFLVNTKRPN